jgi:hypothetical protein
VLIARVTAPVAGVHDGRWEGRLTVEMRCRSPAGAGGDRITILGKEYLYQWSGRAWEMYQHSWLHAGRGVLSAGYGPIGLWWGFVAGLAAVAVLLLWRVRARFRTTILRLIIDRERSGESAVPVDESVGHP